ncbi:MAG: radical SAM family heme chaperone HemW [Verrucomicrobia subdivision 3 bacterium]|nr:radical SAM family heme chaperone HemW [Limisphaerales bacterium]
MPFCARKCAYCAFFSEASNGELIERYTAALVRELGLVAGDLKPTTVFFGGGTPSLLNLRQWKTIFGAMGRHNLLGADEWTIECNPATVSLEKARLWREHGVNRISMGVQSLDNALLDRLGRIHTREMVFKSYDILRNARFENINLDLMFAIPGQSLDVWRSTLNEIVQLDTEHLSCYEVIYEEDTPLFAQLAAGQITPDEDLACAMYDALLEQAAAAGFQQYEIANFAKHDSTIPGQVCRHNINYWRGGNYHGLGPSACGYVRGVRTRNWSNTALYCERLERGERAVESIEELPPLKRAGETAAFGLRMNSGWPFADFQRVTGFELHTEWSSEMADLVGRGWGKVHSDRFHLTAEGLRFADAAAELFLR